MKIPSLNRQQSQELDRRAVAEYGMSGLVLMENAGRGLADTLGRLGARGPVVICCGRGNNGGDGFVLARHLDLRGLSVRAAVWANPADLRGDAVTNFTILSRCDVPIEIFNGEYDAERLARILKGAEWIVDALLGAGSRGEPRPPLDRVIAQLNAHPALRLAVDLPSGLDGDTGAAAANTIRAEHTCTFVAQKPGFLAPAAKAYTGEIHVLDVGAPRKLINECLRATAT